MEQIDLIVVIANKFTEEDIMGAANEAGAHGGTVIHGRGTADREHMNLLGLSIDPEKEVLLIISPRNKTKEITAFLKDRFDMTRPNKGILFVIPVKKHLGIKEL
jgi:nitrogen regulatory protein PII